ncbi:MAG: methionyl-tRNA formyltransferase [Candidatus Pacebacteria bacterium]|nr:methionyl-tRNA formyltransferase [Candidatus Paceibacterota bacterium]
MKPADISIAFFGTPTLAVWVLEELHAQGIEPNLVVTTPDKPTGRRLTLTPPPVKVWADAHDIPVLQTASLKDPNAVSELANTPWDLFIVAAYNIILPRWVLDLPRHGVLNVHPSLLPKLRGPSPVRSAILHDAHDAIGVSIMCLDEQIDHGPLVAQATVELPEWPVRGSILDEILFREGGRLLGEVIPLWITHAITPEEQDHARATFTKKFIKEDGELDRTQTPYQQYLQFCAMDGWPGTFYHHTRTDTGASVRVKILDATYTQNSFEITRVVPEGKKEMSYEAFLRGTAG